MGGLLEGGGLFETGDLIKDLWYDSQCCYLVVGFKRVLSSCFGRVDFLIELVAYF